MPRLPIRSIWIRSGQRGSDQLWAHRIAESRSSRTHLVETSRPAQVYAAARTEVALLHSVQGQDCLEHQAICERGLLLLVETSSCRAVCRSLDSHRQERDLSPIRLVMCKPILISIIHGDLQICSTSWIHEIRVLILRQVSLSISSNTSCLDLVRPVYCGSRSSAKGPDREQSM